MISVPTLTSTREFYSRYIAMVEETAQSNLVEAMERVKPLLSVAAHDRAQGTYLQFPDGTDELIAKIHRELAKRVFILRDHHLDYRATLLQERLEEFRSAALSAGYHLIHQN